MCVCVCVYVCRGDCRQLELNQWLAEKTAGNASYEADLAAEVERLRAELAGAASV